MFSSVINSVLANLEASAVFLQLEVMLSSLLDRQPMIQLEKVNQKLDCEGKYLFVNNAFPRYLFASEKTDGSRNVSYTTFIKTRRVRRYLKYAPFRRLTINGELTDNLRIKCQARKGCPHKRIPGGPHCLSHSPGNEHFEAGAFERESIELGYTFLD